VFGQFEEYRKLLIGDDVDHIGRPSVRRLLPEAVRAR
jgi:hypothetical protein